MARTLSSNIENQITQEGIRVVHLLKLDTSTSIKVTNHVKNLVYASNTYEAGGNFLDIAEVQETGSLEYSNLNIGLNNVTDAVRDVFKAQDYISKTATVFVAFLDANENIIDAYEYFKGTIASSSISEAKEGFKINIELASQWKNWEIKKGRRYTQASQQSYIDKKIDDGDLTSGFTDVGLSFAHEATANVRWNR